MGKLAVKAFVSHTKTWCTMRNVHLKRNVNGRFCENQDYNLKFQNCFFVNKNFPAIRILSGCNTNITNTLWPLLDNNEVHTFAMVASVVLNVNLVEAEAKKRLLVRRPHWIATQDWMRKRQLRMIASKRPQKKQQPQLWRTEEKAENLRIIIIAQH